MSDRSLLAKEQIQAKLTNINWKEQGSWFYENNTLIFKATFSNFAVAFSFLTKVALISEKLNHHATIENTYNQVKLILSTHDAGGVTNTDFKWIEELSK